MKNETVSCDRLLHQCLEGSDQSKCEYLFHMPDKLGKNLRIKGLLPRLNPYLYYSVESLYEASQMLCFEDNVSQSKTFERPCTRLLLFLRHLKTVLAIVNSVKP